METFKLLVVVAVVGHLRLSGQKRFRNCEFKQVHSVHLSRLSIVQPSRPVDVGNKAVDRAFFVKIGRVLDGVCARDFDMCFVRTDKLASHIVPVIPRFVVCDVVVAV